MPIDREAGTEVQHPGLDLVDPSLLAPGVSILHNVPDIQDVHTMQEVLEYLGADVDGGATDRGSDLGAGADGAPHVPGE